MINYYQYQIRLYLESLYKATSSQYNEVHTAAKSKSMIKHAQRWTILRVIFGCFEGYALDT